MSVSKPASLPRWADSGGDIVEPNSGKKDTGWVDDEEPANEFFNWWQNNVYQWTQYVNNPDLVSAGAIATAETGIRHAECIVEIPFQMLDGAAGNMGDYSGYLDHDSGTAHMEADIDGAEFAVNLPLRDGDRLKAVHAVVFDNDGGTSLGITLWRKQYKIGVAGTNNTELGTRIGTGDAYTSANYSLLTITDFTDEVIAFHPDSTTWNSYRLFVTADSDADIRLQALYMVVDRVAP